MKINLLLYVETMGRKAQGVKEGGRNRHLLASESKVTSKGNTNTIEDIATQLNNDEITREKAIERLRKYLSETYKK